MSFGVCFVPMLASYKISGKINPESINKYLLFTFALINILLIVNFISKYGIDVAKYASIRISIRSESGNPPLLNPITIGTYGGFLLITLMFAKLNSLIKIPLFIIAVTNLILSASLGPFMGLVIMVITYLCFKWRTINKIVFLALALILAGILFIVFSGIDERFFLINRLMNLDSNQSAFIRIESIELAFDQIKSNLIFGTHFFVTKNSSSPHNIFIDIFLSTGLLGIGLILYPVFQFFKHFIKDNGNTLILQIALYTFILAQTSGYVFGLSDFWPTFALSLGIISINTNYQAITI
jgi:O-antigen ligase